MKILFCGQVPKDASYPEAIEDAVEIAIDASRLAISDGASESFDSKTWAEMLVNNFVQSSKLNSEWLSELVVQYRDSFDLSTFSWSKHAAFERGSFATLLGIEETSSLSSVQALSIGDSLAVLLNEAKMIDSYPYRNPQEFQQRPELFGTNSAHNAFIVDPDFHCHHQKIWDVEPLDKPQLLCMTDALGEWALKMEQEGTPKWEILLSISETIELEAIVMCERKNKRMRVDDVTLVSIALFEESSDELPNT